jgi:hypothetical protein
MVAGGKERKKRGNGGLTLVVYTSDLLPPTNCTPYATSVNLFLTSRDDSPNTFYYLLVLQLRTN